jgi:hypothetical protein
MKPFSMTFNVAFDEPAQMRDFLLTLTKAFEAAQTAVSNFVAAATAQAVEAPSSVTAPATFAVEPAPVKGRGRPRTVTAPVEAPAAVASSNDEVLPGDEPVKAEAFVPQAPVVPVAIPSEITLEKLRGHAQAFVKAKGAGPFAAVLTKFGVGRLGDLKVEHFKSAWTEFAV